jgi:urea-proton symporter
MLIPIGVILYTAAGGLKATFMASYIHTAIVYIALLIFTFSIYGSSEDVIGSPSKVRCCFLGAPIAATSCSHPLPHT